MGPSSEGVVRGVPRRTEEVVDYSGFEFAALWKGREKITELERSILSQALDGVDRRRVLEVGTGFGRLLGTLTDRCSEVVATDFDLGGLERLSAERHPALRLRVGANLYHLPFADGSFSGATMIRIYHHLPDPTLALAELARVVAPGG